MSPDPDGGPSDSTPGDGSSPVSDSSPVDETTHEGGDPGLAGQFGEESVDAEHMLRPDRLLDPSVYGTLLLVGIVLLVLPEPISSTIGLMLVLLGLFVAAVDALSPG